MAWRTSGTKYGSRRASVGGRSYHSGLEAQWALILQDHLKAGRLLEIKEQYRIRIWVNGKHITDHLVDFMVTLPDGRQKYVEVKGFPTEVWLLKRKLVEAVETVPYLVNPPDKVLFS